MVETLFGKDKLLVVWDSAKVYWIACIALVILSFFLILWRGLEDRETLEAAGTIFFILFDPYVLYGVGYILSNLQLAGVFYISYLLGKKCVDKPALLFAVMIFLIFSTVQYIVSIMVAGILTGTLSKNLVLILLGVVFFTIIFSQFYVGVCWGLYFLGLSTSGKKMQRINSADTKFASFWRRLAAKLIDVIGAVVIYFVFYSIFIYDFFKSLGTEIGIDYMGALMLILSSIVVLDAYFFVCHWLFGYTIGKKLVGIKVVKITHERLSFIDSFMRTVGEHLTQILFFSYYWILIDREKQALHDKLAETYVVTYNQKEEKVAK